MITFILKRLALMALTMLVVSLAFAMLGLAGLANKFSDRWGMIPGVILGTFGRFVCAFLSGEGLPAPILSFGIPDTFVQHGRRDQLLKYLGLTPELMTQRIVIALKNGEKHQ